MKDWWDAKHWTGPWTLWQLWLYHNRKTEILERFQRVCLRRANELLEDKGTVLLKSAVGSLTKDIS